MTPLAFLQTLYAGVTATGVVEFRFLKGGQKHWQPWPTHEHHPDLFTPDKAPKGKDVYFGVALRKDQSDGKAANCKPTHLVWCDVDLADHPELCDGQSKDGLKETSPEELAEYKASLLAWCINTLADHDLSLRCAVDSGHGVQLYLAREYATDADDTERFNKALAALLGGDTRSTDIARILRVPGTKNLKNPARPLPVQVMYSDESATVTDAALEALPVPVPEKVKPESISSKNLEANLSQQEKYAQTALQAECEAVQSAGEGKRNNQLNISAVKIGSLVGAGVLDEALARQELHAAARAAGLPDDEIADTLHSGLTHGKANPRDLSNVGKPPSVGKGTIGKNAEGQGRPSSAVADSLPEKPGLADYRDLVLSSFMERGLIYRYHQVWRNWWRYDGGVYVEVPDEVMAQVVDLTLQAYDYTLKNAQVTEITVKIARDPGVGSREVDQGAWELNTKSGILNLETLELYPHTPEYYSIIQSAAQYDPARVAHDWLAFLREAVPDEADRELLQMFAGLCLTGDTSPQRALLLVGDGGTGKSTFVRVLQAVLGNLATSSALENIKDGSFLVGTLVGKRLCVVSELQRNVDWLPFKRVTGEDTISIDVKNKTPYTAKLDIKLVILSNVMPFLGDDTSNSSLMRRFLPVPFNVKPAEPDPTLEARLTEPAELSGVLNWMLEGLAKLQARGMRFPASDSAALAREIVEESNRVVTFLRDRCAYIPDASISATEIYGAYREWCGATGHKPLSSTSFGKQLVSAGKFFGKDIGKLRKTAGVVYSNIQTSNYPHGWEEVEK